MELLSSRLPVLLLKVKVLLLPQFCVFDAKSAKPDSLNLFHPSLVSALPGKRRYDGQTLRRSSKKKVFLRRGGQPLGKLPKKKTVFFWEISPKCGWVGWLTPKQGPNPSKPPQIAPKIAFFDPNFTFRFPKSHKNPGVGGWVNRFGRDLPKKNGFFFWQLP